MNKIIPVLLVFILTSCSTEQIKTADKLSPVQAYAAKTQPVNFRSSLTTRLPSKLKMIKPVATEYPVARTTYNEPTEVFDKPEYAAKEESLVTRITSYLKQGLASWYGAEFHGKKTATGELFNMYDMTAAHKTLPLSSYAQVTNLENHRSVIVRINDRGPFHGNRLLDLSYAAAKKLDIARSGTGTVEVKAISPDEALPELQQVAERQEKNLYLEVGSFGNEEKAVKLKNKIEANNLPQPKILHAKHRKSSIYKVQIGPIQPQASVNDLSQKLAALGIRDTHLVTEFQ